MSVNLDELNESQRAAVLYNDGPSLVIAGAGSGKTRVLTYKIAYLLEQGYAPSSILALTFTNKAANEMKSRIAGQVGWETARHVWMGTFHSIFSRILRAEASLLGFSSNFTIYDQSDSRSLIRSIIKELNLDEKTYKPAAVQSRISNAKNHLILPRTYAADPEIMRADAESKIPATKEIYHWYVERCKQAGAMDFDDLLVYTYLLFKEHPEVRSKYADLFRYVLVDEYQDTNFAQHQIVWQLTEQRQRVCVVGDDAQSIYSFRGARIENILKFTRQYQGAQLFKLEQNYRSTRTIVQAANSLIDKNREQIRKEVYSEKEQGEPIPVFAAYSDVEEGEIVVNQLTALRRGFSYEYSDFAILYRTNAQSRIFEEALRKRSIPYRVYGGLSFYQRKEVKDAIAYFRLAINPHDEEALKRVINYPARGIGDTTLSKVANAANAHHVSLWDVLNDPLGYGLSINKGTHAKLQDFRNLIATFIEAAAHQKADEVGKMIITQSGILQDVYQDRTPENLSRQENVEELMNGIQLFCVEREEAGESHLALTDFLSEVSLLSDQDSDKDDDAARVTLMTVHSAKGLEFKNVFVVGMEEELFPSGMAGDNPRALEEERRLFYVAITRAEEHCILSYARSRFRFGKTEFGSPSRFLRDIDHRFLDLSRSGLPQGGPSSRMTGGSPYGGERPVTGGGSYNGGSRFGGGFYNGGSSYNGGGSNNGGSSYGGGNSFSGESRFGGSNGEGRFTGSRYGGGNGGSSRFGGDTPSRFGGDAPSRFGSDAPSRFGSDAPSRFGSDAPSRFGGDAPSRFGGNTPSHDLSSPSGPRRLKRVTTAPGSPSTSGSTPAGGNSLQVGQVIEHERFGIGEIKRLEGVGENAKITVSFRNVGDKQLLVKYARFKVIG